MTLKKLGTMALTALVTASFLTDARADITTGLVGYWNLSDGPGRSTVTDLSGNGNTGTLVNFSDTTYQNMWTTTTDPSNEWAYALEFNQSGEGIDDYVSIPDSTTLDQPTANKAWTLSAWVFPTEAGASEPNGAGILCKGTMTSSDYAYCIYLINGKFAGGIRNNTSSGGFIASNSVAASANTWYNVVVTVQEPRGSQGSQNSEMSLYVNGQLVYGTNANTYTTVYSSSSPVTIGCFGLGTLPFAGIIDEVRIYDRQLAASDVTQLYQNRASSLINNGVGYWNGLAGSGGNATLDNVSLNFCTNTTTTPLGTAYDLPNLLTLETAGSLAPSIIFADYYYSNAVPLRVTSTNLAIATGGVAVGDASGAGAVTFLNLENTYILNSSDTIGISDGADPTSLAQSGLGTTILTGTNTFSGGTTINEGTVQLGNGGATGSPLGAGTVTDNGTLVFRGNDSPTFNNAISGAGGVTQNGSGTLTLGVNNSYSGVTTVNSGALSVASMNDGTSSIGTGAVNLGGTGAALVYTGTGDTTARQFNGNTGTVNTIDVPNGVTLNLSGRVTGTAAWVLNKLDTGTLSLGGSADNSFLGMTVNAGTVVLNKSGGTGHAIGNPLTVASGATLQMANTGYNSEIYSNVAAPVTINSGAVFDLNGQSDSFYSLSLAGNGSGGGVLSNSASGASASLNLSSVTLAANTTIGGIGSITLTAPISGLGSLTYAGVGTVTLVLQGNNTYSGGTFVNSGTLDGNTAASIPANATVSAGATLQLDDFSAMSPTATLTLASTALVTLNFGGTQNIGGLVIGGTPQPHGTYGSTSSGATYQSATFSGNGVLNVMETYWDGNHTDAGAGNNTQGGGSGSWDNSSPDWWVSGSADSLWTSPNEAFFAGMAGLVTLNAPETVDGLIFTTSGYDITNTDGTSVLTLAGEIPAVNVPAGTTTISCDIQGGGSTTGLTVTGPGTLVLSGTNTYNNGTLIGSGTTLSVNSISDSGTSAIGNSGNVILNGGTISYTGSAAATTGRNFTATGAVTSDIDVPANSGSLTITGQVEGAAFAKSSSGTLYLGGSADNTSLGMAINGGTVVITKASASGAHGLGGGNSSVTGGAELQLAGSGNFDLYSGCILTVASGGVLDVNSQDDAFSTLTLSGTGIGGSGVLINSTTTATSVLTNGGSGVVLSGPVTVGGPGSINLTSLVNGTGPLTYAGTGTLTLSDTSANTYTGGTVINSGSTVSLTNSAAVAGTGTITDSGTLNIGISGNNAMLTNTINGNGVINIKETVNQNLQLAGVMSGFTGTINCPTDPGGTAKVQILTANVNLSSSATINIAAGGTLFTANSGVIIPCPINIYGAGNAEIYGALRMETSAVVSGPVNLHANTTMGNGGTGTSATISGVISQSGGTFGIGFTATPGQLILTGTNTYGGPTTISNGGLIIGGTGSLGSGNYSANISNYTGFQYASSVPQTLSGTMSGTGVLVQNGPGPLTLTTTNSFTGNITNNSTLIISGSGCLGVTSAATNYAGGISNSGTFDYTSSAVQTLSGVISGTGTLIQGGAGKLTLSGGNSFAGNITISSGSTLAMASTGSINDASSLNIAAGAIFDVSAFGLAYTLSGVTTLHASGTGIGATAATIKGASSSATVNVNGPVTLGYTPQTFNGDATHPALYISQGALDLGGTGITVSNASATPLGAGTYSLIQVAGGNLSVASASVTVTGTGLAAGGTAALAVSGGNLNLVVTITSVPTPVITGFSLSDGSLVFGGTNGPDNGTYHLLSSTNVALPLSQWTTNLAGTFSATGTFTNTNAVSVSPAFFILKIP